MRVPERRASKNSTVQVTLKELLNANPFNNSYFSQNGVIAGSLIPPVFLRPGNLQESPTSQDSIYFVTPNNNQSFSSGSIVNINIQSSGNISKIL